MFQLQDLSHYHVAWLRWRQHPAQRRLRLQEQGFAFLNANHGPVAAHSQPLESQEQFEQRQQVAPPQLLVLDQKKLARNPALGGVGKKKIELKLPSNYLQQFPQIQ